MSFVNYRTNPKDPLKQEKKRRKMAEKSQGIEPSGELYKLQEISQEKQIKEARDFDKIMDSEMGVDFGDGKVYFSEEELKTDQQLKREFGLSEFSEKEVELGEDESTGHISEQKFEEGTGFSLSELRENDEEKRNLIEDWEQLKAEEEEFGEPSPLEIQFEEA